MKRKSVSIGRDGSRESFHRKPRDSAAGTRTRGKRRESLLRASTVADEIICGIRSLWKRVSMGSCEIPGVLTRAIYHARSVFAYVVKGPRRLCRGHRVVECLLKFACLRILLSALPLCISASLYFTTLPRSPSMSPPSPSSLRKTSSPSNVLRIFYRST